MQLREGRLDSGSIGVFSRKACEAVHEGTPG